MKADASSFVRLPLKIADGDKEQGSDSAEDYIVYEVDEDASTGATELVASVEFEKSSSGSALVIVLALLAFLSCLLVLLLETMQLEKTTARSVVSSYQATLAAESGLSVALTQLSLATSNHPAFLVGQTNQGSFAPLLVIGATNLTTSSQLMPLISGDLTLLASYPAISPKNYQRYLQAREETNHVVDLNKKNHPIAASGFYPAPWVTLTNSLGRPFARYAYVLLDEAARVNPTLHQGMSRADPDNWDQGPALLPLSLGNDLLLSKEEAASAIALASNNILSCGSFALAFANNDSYEEKKLFLSRDQTPVPDLIPMTLPDGGRPKYDLNELATNVIFGATKTDRAMNITSIIDRNLPHFKERDPSLLNTSPSDQCHYLNRLAAGIVDYINVDHAPTLVNGGEPAGRNLFPMVTQTAERTRLQSRGSNSVTIENQYFVQVWNPYTKPIPAGATVSFFLSNRQRLYFGTAPAEPFHNYNQTIVGTPCIRPNESVVLAFPTVIQTWISPTTVEIADAPHWLKGPDGNEDPQHHQAFQFYWNGQLVDMSRRVPVGPGLAEGGLDHDEGSLATLDNDWQCNFIPTESDDAGHFRFVGDPRENYLSNYLWKSYSGEKSYLFNTRWQGIMSDASAERLFNPAATWGARDFIPINPPSGNKPTSLMMTPDQVLSPYLEERDAKMAPFVLRNGPMNSIVELGHINDPAQADDLGGAPQAGSSEHQTSIYASGGGRTLRIGQPEFSYLKNNWDVDGKRAIELIDLFSVISTNNTAAFKMSSTNQGVNNTNSATIFRRGLININTAPYPILTALFYNITPTSDQRFTNSSISLVTAEQLATFIEEHRPYEKLSDLHIITPLLANAESYTPALAGNVTSEGVPLAAVFDRAREEGFGKMINLCTMQSRSFRAYILGQALNVQGKPTGEAMIEATLALSEHQTSSATTLIPVVTEIKRR